MALDYDDVYQRSRDVPAFSCGTEGYDWMENWCYRPCLRDLPYQNGLSLTGCPLIVVALLGRTPAEWIEQPWQQIDGRPEGETAPVLGDRYHCIEFRAPGSGGGEPKPKPKPPDQGELFPRPPRRPRMLTPSPFTRLPEHLDQSVEDVEVGGGLL